MRLLTGCVYIKAKMNYYIKIEPDLLYITCTLIMKPSRIILKTILFSYTFHTLALIMGFSSILNQDLNPNITGLISNK